MFIPMFLITLEAPDFNQNKTSDLKKTQETKEIEKKGKSSKFNIS
jgi:hypothetical protein